MSESLTVDNNTGGDGGPQLRCDGVAGEVRYERQTGNVFEFFAYETLGAAIPHCGAIEKTDDPALMKALGDGIESGRVVMDGNTVVSVDGKPVETLDEMAALLLPQLEAK